MVKILEKIAKKSMLTVTMRRHCRRCVALMWAALVFLLGLVTCRCRVVLGCLGELGGCGWSMRVVGGARCRGWSG
jgi:RNase P subunit RPR2